MHSLSMDKNSRQANKCRAFNKEAPQKTNAPPSRFGHWRSQKDSPVAGLRKEEFDNYGAIGGPFCGHVGNLSLYRGEVLEEEEEGGKPDGVLQSQGAGIPYREATLFFSPPESCVSFLGGRQ